MWESAEKERTEESGEGGGVSIEGRADGRQHSVEPG